MKKTVESTIEKDLRRCFESYRVLEYQDLIRQTKRPVPEKKKPLPFFNENAYKKRYVNDFSVFFEDESALKAFLRKKYNREVKEIKEYNRQTDQKYRERLAEWECEKKAAGSFYRQYINHEAQGVVWFFRQVIGNIPHAFFNRDVFDCEYDQQYRILKVQFVFPNTAEIFDGRDASSQIRSINDPAFKPYYYGILILMIRVLFTALHRNDVKKAVEQLNLQGTFSHSVKGKAGTGKVHRFEITFPTDEDSLKKIHQLRPEDLMKRENISSGQPVNESKPAQSGDKEPAAMLTDESFKAFKEKLLQALQHLSDLEAAILANDPKNDPKPSNTKQTVPSEDREKYTDFLQKVNGLPQPLMKSFTAILRLNPAEKHDLSSINISRLGTLQLVNRLIYQGIPLITLTGTSNDLFVWGANYPEDLIHELRRQFLKEGESLADGN